MRVHSGIGAGVKESGRLSALQGLAALVAGSVLLAIAACFSEDPAAVDEECRSFASSVTVEIQDYRFVPATACVARGGTVTWINRGAELHTTTGAAPAGIWDSGMLANGADFAHAFETAGSFAYFCIPHPFMEARVIVQ